jgi:hypothetical protein
MRRMPEHNLCPTKNIYKLPFTVMGDTKPDYAMLSNTMIMRATP